MKTILITAIQMKVSGQTDKTKPCNLGGEKWDLPRITIINRKCKVNLLSDFTMKKLPQNALLIMLIIENSFSCCFYDSWCDLN